MAAAPFGAIAASPKAGLLQARVQWQRAIYSMLVMVGLYTLWGLDWKLYRDTWQARAFVSAEGQIITVSLDDATILPDGDGPMRGIVVEYRYASGGEVYTGHAATLRDWEPLEGRRLRALYRDLAYARLVGRPVPVFVNPADPAEALLDRNLPQPPSKAAIAFAVWCLVAGAIGFTARSRQRGRLQAG